MHAIRREILAAVNDLETLGAELQSTWLREIPLAAAIGVTVAACSGDELAVRAPLAPNINVHGTAFAGSLFSVCVLTGWGATWLALRRAGLAGQIVVADCRINYRKAVAGEILCRCAAEAAALEAALAELGAAGRTSLRLVCTIDAKDRRAVTFEGTYVVHAKR